MKQVRLPSRAAWTLTLGVMLLVATTIFAQQASSARTDEEATTKLVCKLITKYHISHGEIDDGVSQRLFDGYVEALDFNKLYFTQSDIDELKQFRNKLDDLLQTGDTEFAHATFKRFLKRLDARMELAHGLIDIKHDFTLDEEKAVDPDSIDWAGSKKEINERWRKRIKYELLLQKLDDKTPKEARERLHKRYRTLQKMYHDMEPNEIFEMYLTELAKAFDPHSQYLSPESLQQFRIDMELSLEGIGAALKFEDGYTEVADIIAGGAAEEDGRLKIGDTIIGVAQAEGDFVDVVDMKLTKVVRLIRGKRGTVVRLKVKTAATGDVKVYDITRQKIQLESAAVKGEVIETGERLDGRGGKVGVIHIPTFYRDFRGAQRGDENFRSTARDVRKVLAEFRDAGGVDAIVVDLRDNGGGALSEAIEVSGLFIDKGPVVQIKELDGSVKMHEDVDEGVYYSGPLVVLCNRRSASASEIFAGAIKDYGRGIVIGDSKTHGKGTVQNVMPVSEQYLRFLSPPDRGALKLTINQFYRVNGDSTQNRGVHADIVLPSKLDHYEYGEEYMENALEFDRIDAAEHTSLQMVNKQVVAALKNKSRRRVSADEKFQQLQRAIDRIVKRKNRKTISLNYEELKKERDEEEETKKGEEADADEKEPIGGSTKGPVFPEGYYNDEVLEITLDYVASWKALQTAQK